MDIPRKSAARNRRIRWAIYIIVLASAVVGISLGVSRLKPAAPTVERATVWVDTVKRGPMLRQVRGLGTLVPEEILWIPAFTEGRVERRLVKPGTEVKPDTVLLELSNPELELTALDAEFQLKVAEAQYTDLRVRLESQSLDQQAGAAQVRANYLQAKLQADRDAMLAREGLLPDINLKLSQVTAEQLATRHEIEQKRLAISNESVQAQLDAQKVRIEQLRALFQLKRKQVEQLRVRAGATGVLQEMRVEVGQRVAPGTNLARVANPERLRAEIKIAETQAKDVAIGQVASIDTRNGIIPGRVSRVDPASQNGTVTVDVSLEGPMPKGARPDLSVDGTVEIERLDNVIYVGRPAFGQEKSVVGLFKLVNGGKSAVRVQVKLGRSSVNTIEILEGLQPGDQVILSDTSTWDNFDRIDLS